MLWAACCTGFFGFLRSGEFTCQSLRAYSMLSPRDVPVDSPQHPRPFVYARKNIHLWDWGDYPCWRTGQAICPVAALLSYIARRGQAPGPLYIFRDGSPLSKARLLSVVKAALVQHGIDTSQLIGHSFPIGAAFTAARAGLEDSLIQTLGRWHSSAFLRYIRTSPETLSATSAQLLRPTFQSATFTL